jgi:hypothetical protein
MDVALLFIRSLDKNFQLHLLFTILLMSVPCIALADIVTYQGTGSISSINQTTGFPSSLQSVKVGDPVFVTFSYDSTISSSVNPVSYNPKYAGATYYIIPNTFSMTINGIPLPIGGNNLSVWVWNNDSDDYNFGDDGIEIMNTLSSQPYYLNFGNLMLPPNTFNNESLPTSSFGPIAFGIYNSTLSSTYLWGDFTWLTASNSAPTPCECDLNHDGRCDMRDWLLFGQRWGATNCLTVPCACDLNGDGRCDMHDWLLFGKQWGRTDCPIQ